MYVLINSQTGRTYTGQTDDLQARVQQHNAPEHTGRNFTGRGGGCWQLLYSEEQPTRTAARRREKWLKSGAGRDWLKRRLEDPSGC